MRDSWVARAVALLLPFVGHPAGAVEVPAELRPWLVPQVWQRDTHEAIMTLGAPGNFDDMHIFAPSVAWEDGRFLLWYCGSRGSVPERVFRLGLATSDDGRHFKRYAPRPVFEFGDSRHSVLTPTLLRGPDGNALREDGKLRMWFSATSFKADGGRHTLHESFSHDGVNWSPPSPVLLNHVYAPTVIKTGRSYQMWYTDVSREPWVFRHADSLDGRRWRVTAEPVLERNQAWEGDRLFYPTVVKIDEAYLMWYGSYWTARPHTTALGFAVSLDGMRWYKYARNPVFRPDPDRPWESHYVTSQSVMQLPDGTFRMWYASRKAPPFVNKYFALNTARWEGIGREEVAGDLDSARPRFASSTRILRRFADRDQFLAWQEQTRDVLRAMLGIPRQRVPLRPERRGEFEQDGVVVEKWIFTSEPGSRVPAVLYRLKSAQRPMPAIVLTFGHGGSKSQWQYNYAGQVYAKLGLACLALDPIGEEERHIDGGLGTRAHDPKPVHDRADHRGRLIMGKLVFDTMRGIDFLLQREDIDHHHLGVAGNSLGGATAAWMAALDPRLKMAIVSGWAFHNIGLRTKYCTKVPNQRMRELCTWPEYVALAAPGCAVLVMNGDADWIIDRDDDGSPWVGTRAVIRQADQAYETLGAPVKIAAWFEKDGGHRPYFIHKDALKWIHHHLGTPGWTLAQIRALPTLNAGTWCDAHGVKLETLYGTPFHQRGATLPDLHLRPMTPDSLACLSVGEMGSPEFTIEGWIAQIEEGDVD